VDHEKEERGLHALKGLDTPIFERDIHDVAYDSFRYLAQQQDYVEKHSSELENIEMNVPGNAP